MKYKIALLCVGKNEENYLVEFIEHYMQLGITTIFSEITMHLKAIINMNLLKNI